MTEENKIEYVSNFIKPTKALIKKVESIIKKGDWDDWDCDENPLSRLTFEYKETKFAFGLYQSSDIWENDYKYDYSSEVYHLISLNENNKIKDKYNLFFDIPVSRTGSYFTSYSYLYCYPTITQAYVKDVPELVIPAHKELDFEEI